jgi:hypothetical protein
MLKFTPILLAILYAVAMYRFSAWRTAKELDARSTELADPVLRGVMDRLAAALDLPRIRVHIYEIEPVNGLAAPDGRIFITRGFYNKFREGKFAVTGRATADSHLDLPRVAASLDELRASDFAPFAVLRDLPMAMTAHLVYEALDDAPATLSPRVMRLIRDEIGYDGLIMTDDISMKALRGDLGQISRDALAAGCDVVLLCNGTLDDRRAVAEASGRMTPAAQARAERALAARHAPDLVDIAALDAQLEALVDGRLHG